MNATGMEMRMVPKVRQTVQTTVRQKLAQKRGSVSKLGKVQSTDEIPHPPEPIDRTHRHARQIGYRIADDPDGQRKARHQHDKGQEQVGTRHGLYCGAISLSIWAAAALSAV